MIESRRTMDEHSNNVSYPDELDQDIRITLIPDLQQVLEHDRHAN